MNISEGPILHAMQELTAMQVEREAILFKAASIHAGTGRVWPTRDVADNERLAVLQTLDSLRAVLKAQYKSQKEALRVVKVRRAPCVFASTLLTVLDRGRLRESLHRQLVLILGAVVLFFWTICSGRPIGMKIASTSSSIWSRQAHL